MQLVSMATDGKRRLLLLKGSNRASVFVRPTGMHIARQVSWLAPV